MSTQLPGSPPAPVDPGASSGATAGQKTGANLDAVLEFYARDSQKQSALQRALERVARVNGQPAFLAVAMGLVVLWIAANAILANAGLQPFDPFPYHLLHGVVSLGALLIATVVLIKQERLGRLAEQREHLDLTVTLLTEQKAAKLIELIEELRRDLPNVHNRHDAGAAELKHPINPELVLAALDEPHSAEARAQLAPDATATTIDSR